jgi:L-seryl-tRNA(Ser) seleniumtransferase
VDQALSALCAADSAGAEVFSAAPRPLVKDLVNGFLDLLREEIRAGAVTEAGQLDLATLAPRMAAYVRQGLRPRFRRVLNATGVVVHTNMGRSLLAREALEAVASAAAHYSNLEFDLATGLRGSRYSLWRSCSAASLEPRPPLW